MDYLLLQTNHGITITYSIVFRSFKENERVNMKGSDDRSGHCECSEALLRFRQNLTSSGSQTHDSMT